MLRVSILRGREAINLVCYFRDSDYCIYYVCNRESVPSFTVTTIYNLNLGAVLQITVSSVHLSTIILHDWEMRNCLRQKSYDYGKRISERQRKGGIICRCFTEGESKTACDKCEVLKDVNAVGGLYRSMVANVNEVGRDWLENFSTSRNS
ncbi:hypothetical protein BDF20DRAFT_832252 [Mycotypha africana]|uniref:uncharacterized protein n=1 Tax=Mycotypha africana TaxID=64632 RepID=UPI002301C53C|nr:uncharacterized protein BDF20DRAFT_832252 [Mycotypha africana]KAI8987300.1 hypothetical protein BDF20DRAFT_832252 [Mycotypha africana]